MDSKIIMNFLSRLKKNNNREWFEENKDQYRIALGEFELLVEHIINKLSKVYPDITDLEARKCIFRIYRDIRFSKDKTPYKSHFGAFISPGGKSSGKAGFYIHLEPQHSIAAGGLYRPEAAILAKVRQEVDYNPGELKTIVSKPLFKEFFGEIQGEKLTRAPKGYPPDHPNLELLKLKSYVVVSNLKDKEVKDPDFPAKVIKVFNAMSPFIEYLNVAIS